jgi:hypothetical protein
MSLKRQQEKTDTVRVVDDSKKEKNAYTLIEYSSFCKFPDGFMMSPRPG